MALSLRLLFNRAAKSLPFSSSAVLPVTSTSVALVVTTPTAAAGEITVSPCCRAASVL